MTPPKGYAPTSTNPPVNPEPQDLLEDHIGFDEEAEAAPHGLKEMNVFQRVNAAAGQLGRRLKKRGENRFQNYKFVSHDDIVAATRGPLVACGVVCLLNVDAYSLEIVEGMEGKRQFLCKLDATMTIVNVDRPEDQYEVKLPAYAMDTSDKAIGKAISYAKKYALSALVGLMLATGEDADTDTPQIRQPRSPQNAPQGDRGNQRPATRQQAPRGQGGQAGPGDGPKSEGAPPAAGPPADKARAHELLAQYTDADAEQLDTPILLALSDAYAVMLGCKVANYATAALEAEFRDLKRAPRTRILSEAHRLSMVFGYWNQLRDAVITRNEGDEAKAKAVLKDVMAANKWKHIWTVEPADIKSVVLQFTDPE